MSTDPHNKLAPGSVIPYAGISGSVFAQFLTAIQITDGLTLQQVCKITGLEPYTIQNWVKRGFVARPVEKKYHARQLARILLISALRDCLQIDRIGELMAMVNGDANDESDDIISDQRLYDYLCETIRRMDSRRVSEEETARLIAEVTDDYAGPDPHARQRLTMALQVMVCAYLSAEFKREADLYFSRMQTGSIH